MRTTIDLPDSLVEKTKVAAAKSQSTMRELVIQGLETVLSEQVPSTDTPSALERLQKGYALGDEPLTREEAHAR